MKKKIFGGLVIVTLVVITVFMTNQRMEGYEKLSLLSLANIEALSNDENDDKDKDKKYCDQKKESRNSTMYGSSCYSSDKYSTNRLTIIEYSCDEGGSDKCKTGTTYTGNSCNYSYGSTPSESGLTPSSGC